MSNLPRIIDHDQDGDVSLDPRWVHPLCAAGLLWLIGTLPSWTNLSPWWFPPAGLVLTIAFAMIAGRVADSEVFGVHHRERSQAAAILATATATGIATYAGHTVYSDTTVLGLIVVWTLMFGGIYAALRTEQRHTADTTDGEVVAQRATSREVRSHSENWNPWMRKVKLPGVTLYAVDNTPAGLTLKFISEQPEEGGDTADYDRFHAAIKSLAPLVSKHYAREGIAITANQLRPEETEFAHLFLLHVSTANALRDAIPYPKNRGAISAKDPIQPGVYEDFQPVKLSTLGVHAIMVGATGSGKSTVARAGIAELTRAIDRLVWVASTVKLMPLVFRWLMPWLSGETSRPVIDRIAGEDPEEVLRMLADAYKLAHANNRGDDEDYPISPDDPALTIVIDEVTRLAEYTGKVTTFDGRSFTASALLDEICSVARSAGINVWLFTQYGLIDALGDWGTRILRNIRMRIVGRTMKDYDGTSTLTGMDHVHTTQLRDHTLMVQPDAEEPRAIPAKVFNVTADEVPFIARANTAYVPGDPARWVELMGESYTDRWAMHRQRTLVDLCRRRGLDYPGMAERTLPSGGDGATLPDVDIPAQIRPAPTADTVRAAMTNFRANAANKLDLIEATNGGLGRAVPEVIELLRSTNCPPFVPAWKLAVLSGLADKDDEDAVDRETRYLVGLFSPSETYNCPPEFDASSAEPSEPGWNRHRLFEAIVRRLNVLSGEDRELPSLTGGARVVPELTVDAVLESVAGRDDDEWIPVAELAELCGQVNPDDEQAKRRLAASAFASKLNGMFTLDPDRDRDRKNSARLVRVGGLRDAAQRVG